MILRLFDLAAFGSGFRRERPREDGRFGNPGQLELRLGTQDVFEGSWDPWDP